MTEMRRRSFLEKIADVIDDLERGEESYDVSVKEFLGWAGVERRGIKVVYEIRKILENNKLITSPDFDSVPLDAEIQIQKVRPIKINTFSDSSSSNVSVEDFYTAEIVPTETPKSFVYGAIDEPALKVSRLPAASRTVVWVNPDTPLREALTLMLMHDYSQLPVMTNTREVKGVVSRSTILSSFISKHAESKGDLGERPVRDFMERQFEINANSSIFSAIPLIVSNSYALVRADDKQIIGIVTTTDLSEQLQQLSEPFLLIQEIENHIRKAIDGKYSAEELARFSNLSSDADIVIESVADLTLGGYVRLLQDPDMWKRSGLKVDKTVFLKELERIRVIRNDVMHFDPDGISPDDHQALRNFVNFIHRVLKISIQPGSPV